MSSSESQGSGVSRRRFLTTAGWVAGAAAAGDWRSRRAFAQGNQRIIGANDRIRLGFIGVGSMGGGHVAAFNAIAKANEDNLEIIAVCDIFEPRKDKAKAATGGKLYHQYKELLANPDVDAVVIATPEHWHHRQAVDAMAAGKDVYLEKPMARYIEEAAEVREVALRTGRILQVGAQRTTETKWHKAKELLPKIGKLVWSQTSYCRNSKDGEWNTRMEPAATPQNLDWKAFLGPAKDRPFDAERYFRWRKYWDYSSGICGDLLPHMVYPLMVVFGAEFPTRVVAGGGLFVHTKDREVPDTFHLLADFPSGHTMFVAGSTANQYGVDTVIRGHQARMELNSPTEIVIRPEAIYADEIDDERQAVPPTPNDQQMHRKNWLACLRSRKTPNCGPDLGLAGMVTVGLAEISFRENRFATFKPKPAK